MIEIGTITVNGEELTVRYGRFVVDMDAIALLFIGAMGLPYAKPAIYIDDETAALEPGEFILSYDISSSSFPIVEAMLESGLFNATLKTVSYGRVRDQPVMAVCNHAVIAERWARAAA